MTGHTFTSRTVGAASALACATVLALTGCGSGATTVSSSAPAAAAPAATGLPSTMPSDMAMPTVTLSAATQAADAAAGEPVIHIHDFAFSAPSAPIAAGEKFLVVNDDGAAHTYEDVKHAFESGTISGHGRKEITAPSAGTYQIKCDFHPSMHGTLTVG